MSELEQKILNEISARKLAPKPAYLFLARRSVFWALAIISILLGALSFAILLFAVNDFFATGWRVLDNIQFNEVLIGIPALWLALLATFTASAAYGLRHTRRGYRFKPAHVAALSLITSLGIGAGLFASNAAYQLHEYLEKHFPAYHEFTYVPFAEWSRPDQGFLGGSVMEDLGGGRIRLLDFHDKTWTVDVARASVNLDDPLIEEGDIAIEGDRTGADTFRARTIAEFD